MAATARKLQSVQPAAVTVEGLIDEAGRVKAEIRALENRYAALKEAITARMPAIPEGEKGIEIAGETYLAISEYRSKTVVNGEKLRAVDESLYFNIAVVPVGVARFLLSPDLFHAVTDVTMDETPTLTIKA